MLQNFHLEMARDVLKKIPCYENGVKEDIILCLDEMENNITGGVKNHLALRHPILQKVYKNVLYHERYNGSEGAGYSVRIESWLKSNIREIILIKTWLETFGEEVLYSPKETQGIYLANPLVRLAVRLNPEEAYEKMNIVGCKASGLFVLARDKEGKETAIINVSFRNPSNMLLMFSFPEAAINSRHNVLGDFIKLPSSCDEILDEECRNIKIQRKFNLPSSSGNQTIFEFEPLQWKPLGNHKDTRKQNWYINNPLVI